MGALIAVIVGTVLLIIVGVTVAVLNVDKHKARERRMKRVSSAYVCDVLLKIRW